MEKYDIYTLSKLKELLEGGVINSSVIIRGEGIQNLKGIHTIAGTLGINDTSLESIEDLKLIKGDLYFSSYSVYPSLKTLGSIKRIQGDASLRYSNVEDLGDLEHVGGKLSIRDTPVKDLGKLKYVGGDLFLPKRFKDKVDIDVGGKIRYWNDVEFERIIKPKEDLNLTQYEGEVPYWQMGYVRSRDALRYGSTTQRKFYKEFKARFLEGEYLDIKGNSNYCFILLFDLPFILKGDELRKAFVNLGDHYQKTNNYVPGVAIDTGDSEMIKWAVENYDVFINTQVANDILIALGESNIQDLLTESESFKNSYWLNEAVKFEKKELFEEAWKIRTTHDLCDYHSLRLYDKKIKRSLTTGRIMLNVVYDSTLSNYGLNNIDAVLNQAGIEVEKFEESIGKKITSIRSRQKLELKFRELLRLAENNYRESIGMPKIGEGWISETELYYKIKEAFPNEQVIHHGSPEWLGRQHLDIWIPELKVAVEYQGAQHDQPVDFFGGQEAFEKNQERDAVKKKKCLENGVRLIEVREGYDFKKIKKEIHT